MQKEIKVFKITDDNYSYYKRVAGIIWRFTFNKFSLPTDENSLPQNVLKRWEKESMSRARKGLQTGLVDSLTMLEEAPPAYLVELNEELLKADLPALPELIAAIKDVPAKVLKRGKIRNQQEWYIITEVLSRIDSPISAAEREKLGELSAGFELKKGKKK